VTPADVTAWTSKSRTDQGLPAKIEDEAVLEAAAVILGGLAVLAFEGRDPPNRERPARGALQDRTLPQEPSSKEVNPLAAKRTRGGGGRARR
jgi:hypothetical protein